MSNSYRSPKFRGQAVKRKQADPLCYTGGGHRILQYQVRCKVCGKMGAMQWDGSVKHRKWGTETTYCKEKKDGQKD